jgi:hypothetical protein
MGAMFSFMMAVGKEGARKNTNMLIIMKPVYGTTRVPPE